MHVAHNTDDSHPWTEEDSHSLSDRIFIGPMESRHRLVDDRHRSGLRFVEMVGERLLLEPANQWQCNTRVGAVEGSSFAQRNLHRAEVIVTHCTYRRLLKVPLRRIGTTFDRKAAPI